MTTKYRRAARLITGVMAALAVMAGTPSASAGLVDDPTVAHLAGAIAYTDPTDGIFTVDLTQVDQTLDLVYGTVPSPWGELQFVLSSVPRPDPGCPRCLPQDDPSGGDGETSDCPKYDDPSSNPNYASAVLGGANAPTRSGNYVQGSATLESCIEQEIWAWTLEDLGMSGNASQRYRIKVPARRWITFDALPVACDQAAAGSGKGYYYYTHVETAASYGGEPYWLNDSDYRKWTNC